jgi:peptidoglycan-associated lipoprotein
MFSKRNWSVLGLGIVLALFATGCKKKVAPPPPPAPPPRAETAPPAAPTISEFVAEPSSVERGQSATLRWSTSNATQISINRGIGTVEASGTRSVSPTETTQWTLTATGPGGTVSRSAGVTVNAPAPPPPPAPTATKVGIAERLARDVQDALYDYDKSDIRDDARAVLTSNADAIKRILSDFPSASIAVEGHCDERGSAEYNLGLGDRRATSAKDFLVQLGVPGDRLKTISYGKERPQCTDANETCWQKNRRAHFSAQ